MVQQRLIKEKNLEEYNLGAALGISINGFTNSVSSHFVLNFKGSLDQVLEIHVFTSTGSGNPRVHRNPRNPS